MKRVHLLLAVVSLMTIQAQAALTTTPMAPRVAAADQALTPATTPQTYRSVDYPTVTEARTDGYVLGNWQLHPGIGFTAMNSTAGFNVGSHIAYRLTDEYPLHLEPGLWVSFIESRARFNFMAGMRYDLDLDKTWLKPFARVALGPTLQTTGETLVFNAYIGLGILYPVNKSLDFRADAGMQNVDGNAGFLLTAGIGF
jgi:hypothetical protein